MRPCYEMIGCHTDYPVGSVVDICPLELSYLALSLALNGEQFMVVCIGELRPAKPGGNWTR
jgi:hypothetical protein